MHAPERDARDGDAYHGRERRTHESEGIEPVVLTRKLAEAIDGIDLTGRHVGDRLPLTSREACMLIAEGWARPTPAEQRRLYEHRPPVAQGNPASKNPVDKPDADDRQGQPGDDDAYA